MKWEPSKQLCITTLYSIWHPTNLVLLLYCYISYIEYLNLPEFNEYEDLTRGSMSLEDANCLDIGNSLLENDFEDEFEHSESSSW